MKTVEYTRTTDCKGNFQNSSLDTNNYIGLHSFFKKQLGIPSTDSGRWAISCVKLPDGYRLATEADLAKRKPDSAMYLFTITHSWEHSTAGKWDPAVMYAIPIKPVLDIEVKVTVNGKLRDPSDLSQATWDSLRKG
jgi:hypothetical protein